MATVFNCLCTNEKGVLQVPLSHQKNTIETPEIENV